MSEPERDEQVDILLVDDQPAGLLSLEATLEPLGQRLHRASSGREALRALLDRDFALMLLDVLMPDLDGFETARLIRERERSAKTPIIFLTALSDGALPRLRAYAIGAVDYIVKPFEPEVLRSKVSVFVELARKTELIKKQARALHDAQARQHERDLTRTREEFLAVALHELRTPLTSMSIQLHALKRWVTKTDGALEPKAMLQRLAELEGGMLRLNKLSDYLLDVSRMREGRVALERSLVDIVEIVKAQAAQLSADHPDQAPIRVDADELLPGMWDRARIEQITGNLLINAVKYGGGRPIHVTLRGDDTNAMLTVRDEGVGIPPEDQALLFHRFFRGARRADANGFGLGLWIVHQLVTLHEGTVTMQSRLGEGSTFTVVLPKRTAALAAAQQPQQPQLSAVSSQLSAETEETSSGEASTDSGARHDRHAAVLAKAES